MSNLNWIKLSTSDDMSALKAGDLVLLSGRIFTARDAAHKRIAKAMIDGQPLPIDLKGACIYYVGACFDNFGKPISAGPTTAMRMDSYAALFYANGLKASIGKGDRGKEVYEAIKENSGVYFAAVGGAGATYASKITECRPIAYQDLGTEAIYEFMIKEFPLVVAIDSYGNSIYKR